MEVLDGLDVLAMVPEVQALAHRLIEDGPLPEKAAVDALHIALAATHSMDYLLTWNCAHIANAAIQHEVETVCRTNGFEPPVLCTPEALMNVRV